MTKLFAAALLASSLAGIGFAGATPLSPPAGLTATPDIIQVAGGSGGDFIAARMGDAAGIMPTPPPMPARAAIISAPAAAAAATADSSLAPLRRSEFQAERRSSIRVDCGGSGG
jgi:hypothetical protein